MDVQAVLLSLRLAAFTTMTIMVIGLPLSYVLVLHSQRRWLAWVEALISLPLVLPPTVLGFYLLLTLAPVHLAFTFQGLVIASIIASLPFALQPFLLAFQSIDRELFETSALLGQSAVGTFFRVALPLAKNGAVAGGILAFAHTLGEFGVVLMVGGNIPGVSRTLAISIFDDVEALDYASAHRTAAMLLVVSWLALVVSSRTRHQLRDRAAGR